MAHIVCEECGKRYDFEKDDFCPRCGAFNPPVKTWGMDAGGNIIRVDGVAEKNHDGSFVHKEVHHERDVRRAKGMDWDAGKPRKAPAKVDARAPSPQAWRKEQPKGKPAPVVFIIIGVIILVNILIQLLAAIF